MNRYVCVLCVPLVCPIMLLAGELLKDPGRSSALWKLEVGGTAMATKSDDQGGMRFDITQIDGTDWHAQVYQVITTARGGIPYTVRFKAKANAPRQMSLAFQLNEKPWDYAAGWMAPLLITTDWQDFKTTVTFDKVPVDGKELRVPMFILGTQTGTVWIKDVSVSDGAGGPAAPSTPAAAPAASGSLIRNPLEPSSWQVQDSNGAAATVGAEPGQLKVEIQNPGSQPSNIQLHTIPADLNAAGGYSLQIEVRASAPRTLAFTATQQDSTTIELLPVTNVPVTTEWKRYRLKFNLKDVTPGRTHCPVFYLGGTPGTVYFRTIALTPQ